MTFKRSGHLHGDRAAPFGFPKEVGAELRERGRVWTHPLLRRKVTWASRTIVGEKDVRDVIALMRLNYDRVTGPPGD